VKIHHQKNLSMHGVALSDGLWLLHRLWKSDLTFFASYRKVNAFSVEAIHYAKLKSRIQT